MLQLKVRRVSTAWILAAALALAAAPSADAAGKGGSRDVGRRAERVPVAGWIESAWEWMVGGWGILEGTSSGLVTVSADAGGGIDPNGGTSGGGFTSSSSTCTNCKTTITTVP